MPTCRKLWPNSLDENAVEPKLYVHDAVRTQLGAALAVQQQQRIPARALAAIIADDFSARAYFSISLSPSLSLYLSLPLSISLSLRPQ
jgi:hypothetical protein